MGKLIGRRIGDAVDTGGGGGNFTVDDHYWLAKRGALQSSPGLVDDWIEATGGIVSEYTEPTGNVYKSHVFTNSGTFEVTKSGLGNGALIEYMVVAGGGGGGVAGNYTGYQSGGGGGGAGGV